MQRLLAARPIARGVDDHPQALTLLAPAGDPRREVLHGIDRLAVAADEQPEILAVERAGQRLPAALDVDLGVQAERVDELLQEVLEKILGAALVELGHRLRPGSLLLLARRRWWRLSRRGTSVAAPSASGRVAAATAGLPAGALPRPAGG